MLCKIIRSFKDDSDNCYMQGTEVDVSAYNVNKFSSLLTVLKNEPVVENATSAEVRTRRKRNSETGELE